jgi:hypothetical protein
MKNDNAKRKPVKASNVWKCCVCEAQPEFEHTEMMEHLRSEHHIDTKNTKAKRSMVMHMDGANWFSSTWEWEINGMKFIQNTVSPRDKSDPMSMMHC